MKKITKIFYAVALLMFVITSCEDEELLEKNNPTWETGVNGFGQFQDGSAINFIRGDLSVDLDVDFRWISTDGANEVSNIEFYVNFSESYINKNGDPAVVDHGTELLSTVDSPPANREDLSFTITQMDLYPLFQDLTFDYDEDGTETPVFNNPDKPLRDTSTRPFVDGDSFTLSWVLTTTDGRVFEAWSPSVCTELPGSNCQLRWIVECGQIIEEPAQDYTIVMNDSYGDGWQGSAIIVNVDGVPTSYSVPNLYDAASGDVGDPEFVSNTVTITVPDGTSTLTFEWVSGDYPSECTFTITSEKGNQIASSVPAVDGPIILDLCVENE